MSDLFLDGDITYIEQGTEFAYSHEWNSFFNQIELWHHYRMRYLCILTTTQNLELVSRWTNTDNDEKFKNQEERNKKLLNKTWETTRKLRWKFFVAVYSHFLGRLWTFSSYNDSDRSFKTFRTIHPLFRKFNEKFESYYVVLFTQGPLLRWSNYSDGCLYH